MNPIKFYRRHIYFPLLRLWRVALGSKWVAAGALIFNEEGKLLLIKHRWRKAWEYPAGSSDGNESPMQAAQREILEEVGLEPDSYRLIGVDFFHRRTPNGNLLFTFSAIVTPEQAAQLKLDPFEADAHRWVSREEAFEIISHRLKNRLRELLEAHDTGKPVYLETGKTVSG